MIDPKHFDEELKTYYADINEKIKKEHNEYIKAHPELR
jgi:hypothetical protein